MPAYPHAPEEAAHLVLGVDTHKDIHVAAVLTTLGAALASEQFPATATGYQHLLDWARTFGQVSRAGVEGTGSYGAGLTRFLQSAGVEVTEVNRPDRAARRSQGKTDTVDAEAAARSVLAGRAQAVPKSADGPVEGMRVLRVAKESAVKARTQALNQLKAILVAADPALRESLSGLTNLRLVARCADLDGDDDLTYTLRLLAGRIRQLTQEVDGLARRLHQTVSSHRPRLLELIGIGPDSAAALLIAAGDNPTGLTDEASFAALCGVSPVERSSGKSQRRRLNLGGDRQANAALYRIVISRLRWDDRSRAYLARRTAEGKTKREIVRCLKRYVAREAYRHICTSPPTAPSVPQTA
ncbi:IS110 family transposase [Frankia sp. CcI49]|uniref:IS110 family transposase n=1 Tax=Frankia sp. CcI49 TaxID=1745382 RepID=UPI0009C781D8|nr:IS110 family transposase [Frankia sp. CcI49]ONH58903.1 IS110 family transposase [Frankia sp. CcI49]